MLHEFLTSNHSELVGRCRKKAMARFVPSAAVTPIAAIARVDHGVPLFLRQLVETLRFEDSMGAREGGGDQTSPAPTDIGRAAALHGDELLRLGFSVEQVVHGYGDVCQSVTELAVEQKALISNEEFRTLNRCLDNAIADAVTSYGRVRQASSNSEVETLQARLKLFSQEHRRLVDIATQAFAAISSGNIGFTGATGTLLTHTLGELGSLPERTLPEIRPEPDQAAAA
jgi:hypothetical protein